MDILKKIHREIVTLSSEDSFLVEDRTKEFFDYPMHYHPEMELNFVFKRKRGTKVYWGLYGGDR